MEEYEVTFTITYEVKAESSEDALKKAKKLAKADGVDTKELYAYVDGESMN